MILERQVPENERRISAIESNKAKQDESLKKIVISALTSTAGVIGGIAVFIVSIVTMSISYKTNKKNQELLD